ncbi:hypothetical protein [Lentzea sp. NPDC059081]|uniref:hypothetical protein n=1 Tax=Lentzea sp. NPDC059081 TaxID=3346719 RepID=UPI0036BDF66B
MDEMDLMKKLSDVPSPSPEAYDRARTALRTAMADQPMNTVTRPKRRFSWPRASIAAMGAAAAATAVVIATTSGGTPATPTEAAAPPAVESPLVKLASEVEAAAQPGDASLIIGTKPAPDGSPYVFYTVYSDKGQVFHGGDPKDLAATVKRNDDQATDFDRKIMAAARLAATGEVDKAKDGMLTAANRNFLGIGVSPAEADKEWADAQAEVAEMFRKMGKEPPAPKPRPTGKALESLKNNHLWSNATHALFVGAANAEVRAGVLKLFSTMSDVVTVVESFADGKRVLTLTAIPEILGGDASSALTIDADNGLPIRNEVFPAKDSPTPSQHAVVSYKSSRVTLADVAAGKI